MSRRNLRTVDAELSVIAAERWARHLIDGCASVLTASADELLDERLLLTNPVPGGNL